VTRGAARAPCRPEATAGDPSTSSRRSEVLPPPAVAGRSVAPAVGEVPWPALAVQHDAVRAHLTGHRARTGPSKRAAGASTLGDMTNTNIQSNHHATPAGAVHTNRNRLAALLIALTAMFGVIGVSGSTASASPWDPHVALTGRATCSPAISSTVQWMWVSASNGEQGWATLSGSGITKSYRFDFYRVGTGGTTVTIKYGCTSMGESKSVFGLNRPAVGSYTTRNLCPAWWTGVCWI